MKKETPYWKILTTVVLLIGLVAGFIWHYKGAKHIIWAIIPGCFAFTYHGLAVLDWVLGWKKNPNR